MLSFFDFVKQWGFAALSLPALAGILLGVLFYKAVVLKNGWLELLSLLSFFFVMFYFGAAGSWISFFCLGVYALTFWVSVKDREDASLTHLKKRLSWGRFGAFVWVTLLMGLVMALDSNDDHKFEKNSFSQQDWVYAKARAFKQGKNYGGKALPDSLANFTGYYYLCKAFRAEEPFRREELLEKSSVYFKKYLPHVKDGRQGFWQSLYRYTSKAGRISDTIFFKKRYMYELHLLALYNAGSLDSAKLVAFANKVDRKFFSSLLYTFELRRKIKHTPGFLNLVRQSLEVLRKDGTNSAYENFQSKYDLWFNEQKVQQSILAYLLNCNFSLEVPKNFGFLDVFPFKFTLIYVLALLVIQFFFWWTARYWIIRIDFKGEKPIWSGWFSWLNLGLRKHSPLIRKFILYLNVQDSQEGKEGLFMKEIELLNKNYFPADLILALIVAVKMLIYKIRMKHIKAEAQALEVLQQRINSLSAGLIPLGDETVLQIIEGIRSETQNIYYEFLKQGSFVEARKKLLEKLADLKTLRDMLKSPQANGKINYYDLLGISPKCSQQEITRAYKKLVNSVHPDKNGGDAVFNNITSLINKAYGVLKDPIMRQAYDATL